MKKVIQNILNYPKWIKLLIVSILIVGLCFPTKLVLSYGEPWEDWNSNGWVESDEGGSISLNDTQIVIVNNQAKNLDYVYKDFGVDYISGDWSIDFKYDWSTFGDAAQTRGAMIFTNTLGKGMYDRTRNPNQADGIGLEFKRIASTSYYVGVVEMIQGSAGYNNDKLISSTAFMNPVWVHMYFDDDVGTYGTIYAKYYSNEAMTTLITSSQLALHEENSWRYLVAFVSPDWSTSTVLTSGIIENANLALGVPFEIETIEDVEISYDYFNDQYDVFISGNVTSGEPDYGLLFTAYSFDQGTYYPQLATINLENNIFTSHHVIDGSHADETIYFYAFGYTEDEEYAEGEEYSVNITETEIVEPVVTSITAIDVGNGQDVILYGYLDYGGGETCNVTISYNTYVEAIYNNNWYYVGNTTAVSGEYFSGTINMTVEDIPFVFHAQATNSAGTVNGSDVYFTWWNQTLPSVGTTQATDISLYYDSLQTRYVQVNLNGVVLDDGGGWCNVGFEIRRKGYTEWNKFYLGNDWFVVTSDNFTKTIYGLSPNAEYEYRALITNQYLYNADTQTYTYINGNTVSFKTPSTGTTPSVYLNEVSYYDNYTVLLDITLISDGGVECAVDGQYRELNGSWINSGHGLHGVTTGQNVQTWVDGLDYGVTYEFRARAYQQVIGTVYPVYSNVIKFQLKNPTDTTTPDTGEDNIKEKIDDLLISWDLYTTGGKLLVIIGAMLLVFIIVVFISGTQWKEHISVTLPIAGIIDSVILIFGMVIGYVPVIVTTIIIITFAGLVTAFVLKQFGARNGGNV